ncbi:MAG: hypothetical protein Q7U78_05980 [Gallionella sp.]|nr:hypothetical protein [Gallionella sp.]
MTVLKPEQNTAEAVRALRASFLRRALAPAGIWTVETGTQFAGLHVNIISPKPLPARWRNCETYSELLRTTARDAAAYIAKRSGMPAVEQYGGRLYGSWGRVSDLLSSPEALPVVQAAAIEIQLSGGVAVDRLTASSSAEFRTDQEEARGWREKVAKDGRRVWVCLDGSSEYTYKPPRPQMTKEERAAIMRRHLPNLYAAVGKSQILTVV